MTAAERPVQPELTTVAFYPQGNPRLRLFALRQFTLSLIIWTILGHTVLGFEQSWAHPLAAVGAALVMQLILDWLDARATGRPPRWRQAGWNGLLSFLAPAIIPGLACGMLLYPNDRVWPLAFAGAASVASKVLFRAPVGGGRTQHIFNPSNLGIAATLLLFPWVGFAPPYHFTKNLVGYWHWLVPGLVLGSGIFLHAVATGRLPLCLAWVGGFLAQGLVRSWIFGGPAVAPLVPMTSAAFIVFTLYMVPDPATTPLNRGRQVLFGLAVAAAYGVLQELHLVFGLFFALVIVCGLRGVGLYLAAGWARLKARAAAAEPAGSMAEAVGVGRA